MKGLVLLTGLKQVLDRFKKNGTYANQGAWSIAKGSYDLDWQLYYNNEPVIDCIKGKTMNIDLSGPMYRKITSVIKSVYPDVICESTRSIRRVMESVIQSGTVELKKPLTVDYLDSDDFKVEKEINPGTYEFRVMNIRGWKPRQLKVDGEWYDVMDTCPELEELIDSVRETTGVGNIAPTVDYMGHVNPVSLPGMEPVYPGEYTANDKRKDKKEKELPDDTYDADMEWSAPLTRLLAGESVRKVIGEQFGLTEGN